AEQDIADLQKQVDDGEIDESTAASLEARYRSDLEAARKTLAGMPKPKPTPRGAASKEAVTRPQTAKANRNPLIIGVAAAAMVLMTVIIIVIATGGEDPPAEAVLTSEGIPQPGTGSFAEMEAAVAAQPDNNPMRLALAGMYFDSGDFMSAMNHYSAVTANDPTPEESSTANARIGWMAFAALNDPETALTFLDAAIAMDGTNNEAVLWTGMVYLYGFENGAAAIPYFEQILDLNGLSETTRTDVETMLAEARGGTQ
ncbi:MAG: tetratricopeptide repeat protein, partial [Acidimicrobiia bacterium]|nr:tetratricopeptide repeat protein [Acidimicrobiia bacterium]